MKAEELRVGNYYNINTPGDDAVDVISGHDILDLEVDPLDDFFQPIPLTEEWLLKFGFFSEKLYWSIQIGDVYLSIVKEDNTFCVGIPYEANGTNRKFEFVHQLQNLYHALTGEELTIKE